jgi:hypothetical protein
MRKRVGGIVGSNDEQIKAAADAAVFSGNSLG